MYDYTLPEKYQRKIKYLKFIARMTDHDSNTVSGGPFKWFVLLVFVIYSISTTMSQMMFAPIPKQSASYYGTTGQKFDMLFLY